MSSPQNQRSLPDPELTQAIIDCGLKLHQALGPGLLESAYEHCLAHELAKRGHNIRRQVTLPIHYDTIQLEAGYRLDLIVNKAVIVEIKAIEKIEDVHKAQLLTYLRSAAPGLDFY